jgi:hydroxymethylbilane synthase
MKPLKLGTRRSLLARAQSSAVARDLERAHPGLTVELVGIDTRGDRIQDIPLSQVDGKEFFTAEIDAALASGEVDLTVHSFKDLALERPAAFCLGAVPRRQNPRDIIFFSPDVRAQLKAGATVRIGSSSPRRIAFAPGFLERALPGNVKVELVPLRGNVDTRLRRLREPRGSERHLDGVILAFAGLSRLWQDEVVGAAAVLRELLAGLPRMLLPLTHCPAAPAQGALAIECRSNDAGTRAVLAAIDDAATRRDVAAERALLAERGGGCHQQFGATQVTSPVLGPLLHLREADEQGAGAPQLRWQAPARADGPVQPWDGSAQPAPAVVPLAAAAEVAAAGLSSVQAAFVAHKRALPEMAAEAVNRCPHIWVSGTETWFALAARGVWVEGCAESLGFAALRGSLGEPLLALPPLGDWLALTNEEAAEGWGEVPVLATYRHAPEPAAGACGPGTATHVWWHSSAQYERWHDQVGAGARHACGPGKTAEHLRAAGLADVQVFPSARHWRAWLEA